MAIMVMTNRPSTLLRAIKDAIKDSSVRTWEVDPDGDFTHSTSSGQFDGKAWLSPSVGDGCLTFTIVPTKSGTISTALYGIYHGRFSEMLLSHFDNMFQNIVITALAAEGDVVQGSGVRK